MILRESQRFEEQVSFYISDKKLKRSSIHVNLNMSFRLFSFFPKDRRTCVFLHYRDLYLVFLFLLPVAEQEVSHISHILFSPLISNSSILLIKSLDFFIKLK